MRQAGIHFDGVLAGILTENGSGEYIFRYTDAYVEAYPTQFITFSMPVRKEPFIANALFPFFDGLIPEGWLLDIASKTWKINRNDRMGLLLACCKNCIGAVSVLPLENTDGE